MVVGSDATDALGEAARRGGIHVSVGVTEREVQGSSLYNTALLFGEELIAWYMQMFVR